MRYEPGTSAVERAELRDGIDASLEQRLPVAGLEVLDLAPGFTPAEAARALEREDGVLYAEPNFIRGLSATTPDDQHFANQYGLHNTGQLVSGGRGTLDADIDAPEAWDLTTGSGETVAVIDTGVALDHPDLAPNIWSNPGETGEGRELNGVDDDRNGLIDDSRGWDFVSDDANASDLNGHGTHVAGTIAARGNDGFGVAGVSWNARVLPLRVLDAEGFGTTSDLVAAYSYAGRMGVRVVNASLGGSGFSRAERDAIAAAPNTLFVVAAGNGGTDGVGDSVETTPEYPCAYDVANLLCVAATDANDNLAPFSNHGAVAVDLAAPGRGILSAQPSRDTLVSDGFETGGATRWMTGGTGEPWGASTTAAASGTTSLADSPAGDYAAGVNSWARIATPLPLTGRSGCLLDYRLRLAVGAGDRFFVETSVDGNSWTVLSSTTRSTAGAFEHFSEELSALDGVTAGHIRFRLQTDSTLNADGAHVDDVSISCLSPVYSGDEFAYYSGTSMATPHVAGVAALVWARQPAPTALSVRDAVLSGVDPKPSLAGKTVTGGRLNAFGALGASEEARVPPPAPAPAPAPAPTAEPAAEPASQPTTTPGSVADRTAPFLSVNPIARQRLGGVVRRGLRLGVRCSERCGVTAELVIGRSAARRLRLAGGTRTVRVGRTVRRLAAASRTTVVVNLTRQVRRQLTRTRRLEVWVRVRATDGAGNARVVERRVMLRR